MSTQNTLPSVADAQQYVASQLVAPIFFEKLAEYGIKPQNEKQAEELWQIGYMLQAANENPEIRKAAGADESPFSFAKQALTNSLGYSQVAVEDSNRKLAAAVATDPNMYAAAFAIASAGE